MTKIYTATIAEDPETGDAILPFSEEFLKDNDWQEGDVIDWRLTEDNKGAILTNITAQTRKGKIFGPGVNEWHGVANPNLKVQDGTAQ